MLTNDKSMCQQMNIHFIKILGKRMIPRRTNTHFTYVLWVEILPGNRSRGHYLLLGICLHIYDE